MASRRTRPRKNPKKKNSGVKRPNRISADYKNPEDLVVLGPLIGAIWSVPTALAMKVTQQGGSPPNAVEGLMLIDTGATQTCISDAVAQELGLVPTGFRKTLGAGGEIQNKEYFAHIDLPISDQRGNHSVISREDRVMAIPKLDEHLKGLQSTNPGSKRMIGLLGRDFLRHTKLIYDGCHGHVELRVDLNTLLPTKPPSM